MILKGSLVKYTGKSKGIPEGRLLFVHDVKDGKAVVWWTVAGKRGKKTLPLSDLEVVVE